MDDSSRVSGNQNRSTADLDCDNIAIFGPDDNEVRECVEKVSLVLLRKSVFDASECFLWQEIVSKRKDDKHISAPIDRKDQSSPQLINRIV